MQQSGPHLVIQDRLNRAINDFHRARQQAAMEEIMARLTGRSVELLSYSDVVDKLRITGRTDRGCETIPVEAIVGSVGRYADFSRSFLPRQRSDEQRWAKVRIALEEGALPPIEVYRIGEAYFVLDGNHRVSIARQQGWEHIDACITDVKTRVPLAPDDSPDALIVKAEYAAFLEQTRLDQCRPEADLRVSVPGQYAHLENHIEVHRYFVEEAEGRPLTDDEAFGRWYDEAYLPVVEAIREQGILRYFPGRTETDLYLWVSTHQAALRRDLGHQVRPDIAVREVVAGQDEQAGALGRLLRRTWRLLRGESDPVVPSWSQQRLVERYSGRLVADVLLLLGQEGAALPQALAITQREGALLWGLLVAGGAEEQALAERRRFESACQAAGQEGRLLVEEGELLPLLRQRGALADLLVLQRDASALIDELCRESSRPLLLVGEEVSSLQHILLYYDGAQGAQAALFAATYLAEAWGSELAVVLPVDAGSEDFAHVEAYLKLHELEHVNVEVREATQLMEMVTGKEFDLVALGGYRHGLRGRRAHAAVLDELLGATTCPLLVFP